MRDRVMRSLSILLLLAGISTYVYKLYSLGSGNVRFISEEIAHEGLAGLPGTIGITIYSTSHQGVTSEHHLVIQAGNIWQVETLPDAPKEATLSIKPYGATMLPIREHRKYIGPFAKSSNGRYVAASLVEKNSSCDNPRVFVIFDLEAGEFISEYQSNEQRYVSGLAWSPKSRYVAVLRKKSRAGIWPSELLFRFTGHFIGYFSYFLDIVKPDGSVLLTTNIASNVRYSWGEVIWMP